MKRLRMLGVCGVLIVGIYFLSRLEPSWMEGTHIACTSNNKVVGSVNYTHVPYSTSYVLHSLYVHPPYRRKGFGQKIVKHACMVVTRKGATSIYIQQGPFELDGEPVKKDKARVEGLARLYARCGFVQVGTVFSWCASVIYLLMGLDERPEYLMVKNI